MCKSAAISWLDSRKWFPKEFAKMVANRGISEMLGSAWIDTIGRCQYKCVDERMRLARACHDSRQPIEFDRNLL